MQEEASQLIKEIDEIDMKIADNESILKLNRIDLTSPLVDDQDFPLSNIDLYSVRHARHNIICLQNDRKKKIGEMEKVLAEIHKKASINVGQNGHSVPETNAPTVNVHRTSNDPIARIGTVRDDSPAYQAKLQEDDLIIQFGAIHAGNFVGMQQIGAEVLGSLNKTLKITVLRGCRVHRLELTPMKWSGEGVVGCNFIAVDQK